jgi:hypothetical protein
MKESEISYFDGGGDSDYGLLRCKDNIYEPV